MATTASTQVTALSTADFSTSAGKTSASSQTSLTTLNSTSVSPSAANISGLFSPPVSLSLLARPASSVLLSAQAGQKPEILNDHSHGATISHNDFSRPNTNDFLGLTSSTRFVDTSLPPVGAGKSDFGAASDALQQASGFSAAADDSSFSVSA